MPTSLPVITHNSGDVLPASDWNSYVRDNINKLLNQGHRILTVAQFTALSTPEDGDEAYVEVDATNGIMWHFRYVAAEATYKWRFLGGPGLFSEVTTAENTASGSYVALTTAGPSIALPRSGDYEVTPRMHDGANSNATGGAMSYDIGGTGAVDADMTLAQAGSNGAGTALPGSASRLRRKTGLGTVTLTAKYRTIAGTTTPTNRSLRVTPIRVRHDA